MVEWLSEVQMFGNVRAARLLLFVLMLVLLMLRLMLLLLMLLRLWPSYLKRDGTRRHI
jgi:hypothetical protein